MLVSVCADDHSRLIAINPSDMSGNTGWIFADEDRLTAHTGVTIDVMFGTLQDARGSALYKWVDDYAELRTPEEMAADAPEDMPPEPSEAERFDQIEAGLIELAAIIAGGE